MESKCFLLFAVVEWPVSITGGERIPAPVDAPDRYLTKLRTAPPSSGQAGLGYAGTGLTWSSLCIELAGGLLKDLGLDNLRRFLVVHVSCIVGILGFLPRLGVCGVQLC